MRNFCYGERPEKLRLFFLKKVEGKFDKVLKIISRLRTERHPYDGKQLINKTLIRAPSCDKGPKSRSCQAGGAPGLLSPALPFTLTPTSSFARPGHLMPPMGWLRSHQETNPRGSLAEAVILGNAVFLRQPVTGGLSQWPTAQTLNASRGSQRPSQAGPNLHATN
eukprot:g35165.t1